MAQWIDDDDRGGAVHVPGAYRHVLDRAQRDHDLPDPRTMYWDATVVSPEERERLVAAAKWRKPSMRHAKLLAGDPIVVRKYAALPPGIRRQVLSDAPWWDGTTFVVVTKGDQVSPSDGTGYLAPGPAPE